MFENIKAFIVRLGVKMGFIQDIKKIEQHRKIDLDSEIFERIAKNKAIYQGYYSKWHDVKYINSNGDEEKRNMLTLNVGKVSAQKMAKLIFNEKCDIDVSSIENEEGKSDIADPAKEFVTQTLNDNNFYRDFPKYLEYCYSLGGIALKVYYHEGLIKIAYATADSFIPLSSDSENVDEALFITREKKDKKFYTLLEWHEWENDLYIITNELYESGKDGELGHKVPLSMLYPDLEERTPIANLKRPLFVYLKPNTANNKDLSSPIGVSIYENAYDTLYMIDYLYDFYFHEFKLGKRRISVNRGMLKPVIDENGNSKPVFDSDETVFVPLGLDDDEPIKDLTVGLRVSDIVGAINHNLDVLAMQMGLSAGTFTFEGQGLKTATQVISENSETYQTKNNHELLVELAIKDLVVSILSLASIEQYGLYDGTLDVDVVVNFDDSIAEDRQENYRYYATAVKDGLYPKRKAIMKIFKVTKEEADNILQEIQEESAEAMQQSLELQMDLMGVQSIAPINQTKEDEGTGGIEEIEKKEEQKRKQRERQQRQ